MEPPRKRSRSSEPVSTSNETQTSDTGHPRCYLTRMPLELLAEILSYTLSPRDILALARTSRHFCTVLVNNKSTEFIWRQARARAVPTQIPDFTPNFTEASYASFLFDNKHCEICKRKTREMYHSFALRAVVCDKPNCRELWRSRVLLQITPEDEVKYPEFLHWIPRLERTEEPYGKKIYVRKSDWQQAINEHKKIHILGGPALQAYVTEKQALADALPAKLEFSKALATWGMLYEIIRVETLQRNDKTAIALAKRLQCEIRDLLHTPSYSAIHNARNRNLELVTPQDIGEVKDLIKGEIKAHKEREAHRKEERALQGRLEEVQTTWNNLRASSATKELTKGAIPNVNEFRKLSVVKIYQKSGIGKERSLGDPFVASVLAENLDQWRDAARAGLAAVLGFPGWKNLSKKKLHPVDRLTARFRCQRCDKVASEHKIVLDDAGMDFAEACRHVCGHIQKRKRNKDKWSAEWFVPDQRAVDAISQVLSLCGATSEDVDSIRLAEEAGDRIQCQSCSCVMDVRSVARHCKRHVDCSFALLPVDTPPAQPIEHGLTRKLMRPISEAAQARDLKLYGCRHCARAASEAVTDNKQLRKLFSFNGLRSHLKEKHSILRVADEDFFRQKDTAATDASAISNDA
ncbi:hypothetical protein BD309DRAFT_959585 [Dichomitus squalens]|uniref:Uncharacterized protein n=1 Tax=Dichomitus squalens TaxID=114155 RepID=A0A4Q9NV67_9APHY|nr:hypothetical protein BD309DRAFT_959585 [Dichomitus squalens]TBU60445.1 hypothetical protein BD310DRAFT_922974 [Dichomitus squalens]